MTVANYSVEFLNFVDDSNVILNNTVSSIKLQSTVNCFTSRHDGCIDDVSIAGCP